MDLGRAVLAAAMVLSLLTSDNVAYQAVTVIAELAAATARPISSLAATKKPVIACRTSRSDSTVGLTVSGGTFAVDEQGKVTVHGRLNKKAHLVAVSVGKVRMSDFSYGRAPLSAKSWKATVRRESTGAATRRGTGCESVPESRPGPAQADLRTPLQHRHGYRVGDADAAHQ
jgi:hypothetical protein